MTLDDAMMAPVRRLARFMATLEEQALEGALSPELTVVENFPPFLFQGADAAAAWRRGFVTHARASGLSGLQVSFGAPQDVRREGVLAYFALPTRWSGFSHGVRFEEDGGWSFVLALQEGAWRVRAYGWAVVARADG